MYQIMAEKAILAKKQIMQQNTTPYLLTEYQ